MRVHWGEQLDDASRLLAYAAEAGIGVDPNVRQKLLAGIAAGEAGWTPESSGEFLEALTTLARAVKPVTAESLDACKLEGHAEEQVRWYTRIMVAVGIALVLCSVLDYYVSNLCQSIQKNLHESQQLAVTVNDELFAGADGNANDRRPVKVFASNVTQKLAVTHLTQFADHVRATKNHAEKLNVFTFNSVPVPAEPLELHAALTNPAAEAETMVRKYQAVRSFAQSVQTGTSMMYGALLNCILPMLYAILGACAFLLRSFEQQQKARTFSKFDKQLPRFATAAIGGFVVGLFNVSIATGTTSIVEQPSKVSPLAIAFLVGYSVDVFFTFLEGLIQGFRQRQPAS